MRFFAVCLLFVTTGYRARTAVGAAVLALVWFGLFGMGEP